MKRRTISVHTLSIIAVVVLILLMIPLLVTSIYNRPIADDLVQPYPPTAVYRETGSVWDAFIASIKETKNIWQTRNGIFSSMFLSVFAPYIFHYTYGFIHPIIISFLLVFSCFFACYRFRIINPTIPIAYTRLVGALLSIAILTTMPCISEGLYWYSGAVNYTFFFALNFLLFASLFHTLSIGNLSIAKSVLFLLIYCIGFFFLGGANWMSPTLSIVIYGFVAVYILFQKKQKRYLIPFAFLLLGYALAIFAPGNAVRQEIVGERLSLIDAFIASFVKAFQVYTSNGQYYFFALLLLPVFARLSQYIPKLPKYWYLIPVGSVCILAAAYFPLIYSTYSIFERHENMIFYHAMVLLFVNEALLVVWISQKLSAKYQKGDQFSLKKSLAFVIAFSLIFAAVFDTNVSFSPFRVTSDFAPLKAAIHLGMGYSKSYAQGYDNLVYTLQTTDEPIIPVSTDLESPLLGIPGFHWDPTYWTNVGFVSFYTDKDDAIIQK